MATGERKPRVPMVGSVFGHLTVIESTGTDKWGDTVWRCQCSCGKLSEHKGNKLRRGESKSCGCMRGEWARQANIKHGASARGKMTPEYSTWQWVIDRCENPNNPQYRDWGGRGIGICAEWRHNFNAFLAHIGPRPGSGYTIDRIDNARGYEPGNVRWATRAEQNRNKRNNVWVEFNGERMLLDDWAKRTGIKAKTMRQRLRIGWSVADALFKPVRLSSRWHSGQCYDGPFEADAVAQPGDFDATEVES